MFEIQNRNTLQSKNNVCKSDVKIRDCAHSLVPLFILPIMQVNCQYEAKDCQLTRMAESIALPVNPPRTHSRLYHHPVLRTDGQ